MFLAAPYLLGMLAALIPLVIHLSRSRRTKRMRFSTTRFFTDQFLRSYRMSRLKELLLLLCRMALFALFAIALAKPLLMPKGGSFLFGASRAVVLVLDNSASMSHSEDEVTMFERARAAGRQVLGELGPGDSASIVLAGRSDAGPQALFVEPTGQLGDVMQALDNAEVAELGTDLARAVARAEQMVRSSAASSKEIYVLSDLQDSGWEMGDQTFAGDDTSEVLIFFVSVRPKQPDNLAVTSVQYAAARPMAGVPFSLRPHIRNESHRVRSCDVRLYIDGKKVGEQHVPKIQARRWAVKTFYHTFDTAGWHRGRVEITDPIIGADNVRHFAFQVLEAVRVLAVNGAPSQVARMDELFFLRTALTAGQHSQTIVLDVISPDAVPTSDLTGYRLVVLSNVASLTEPAVEKLEGFVDRGGSMLVFLGDRPEEPFYNQTLAAATRLHGGLLPASLAGIEGDPENEQPFAAVGDVDALHAALASFDDPGFANLGAVTFSAFWTLEPSTDAMVLMQTDDGAPLLCEKPFGKGRVMVFAATCDRDWTNFPVRPSFLPWVYRIVGYLAQEPLGRDSFFATGQHVPLPISASQGVGQVLIKTPDDTIATAAMAEDSSAAALMFTDTEQSGVYTVYAPGGEDAAQLFAANLESYESDLLYLDDVLAAIADGETTGSRTERIESEFGKLLTGRPLISYVDDAGRITEASLAARRGVKLWDVVLVVVLLLALFEPWLANRISQRHYARPGQMAEAVHVAESGDRRVGPGRAA